MSRDPVWEGSSSARTRPNEEPGAGDRELEEDAGGPWKSKGGRGAGVIYRHRESSKATVHAPFLIRRQLNLGVPTPRQKLHYIGQRFYSTEPC